MFCKKKIKGNPGQFKDNQVFCALWGDWIDTMVGCLEICDERDDYLDPEIEEKILKSAPNFNRAAHHAGFELPADIRKAIDTCLYCQTICQNKANPITEIPIAEKINRKELLK